MTPKVARQMLTGLEQFEQQCSPDIWAHHRRVSAIAAETARCLDLPEVIVNLVRNGALHHDVGKNDFEQHALTILPRALTNIERGNISKHPIIGYHILRRSGFPRLLALIALYHHEKCDGSGYPAGLYGDDIPLPCKIVTVADVVDGMSSERTYHGPLSLSTIAQELGRTGQSNIRPYDSRIVDSCLRAIITLAHLWEPTRSRNDASNLMQPNLVA